ncbi:MAG TPA: glycosyltransferase [Sphingomonas sp.]|jgi:rhamnopyranosyl-N-acetylglucosaminyl-diphospho-decaprenol beta-1,3/1,4-galactofuranosyltransferase
MRILAAIVTHNRQALLTRCLDAIDAQRRRADGVFVVNNASTDGTEAMLKQRGVPHVTQPNLGSAGGWSRCIEEALTGGWDAVWLMDDDGYPHADALALLEGSLQDGVPCVSSTVVCEDDPDRFVFPFPVLGRGGLPVLLARRRKITHLSALRAITGGDTYPFAHLFNGALVDVTAVRRIGNVDTNFFLMGDEVDFFMRMRTVGPVLSNLNALHLHPDVSGRPLNDVKVYYYVKNTLILNKRYLDKKWVRHGAAVVAALVRTARRNGVGAAMSYITGSRRPLLAKAIRRGLRGQVGKDMHD